MAPTGYSGPREIDLGTKPAEAKISCQAPFKQEENLPVISSIWVEWSLLQRQRVVFTRCRVMSCGSRGATWCRVLSRGVT
jgi:hypothetical protein